MQSWCSCSTVVPLFNSAAHTDESTPPETRQSTCDVTVRCSSVVQQNEAVFRDEPQCGTVSVGRIMVQPLSMCRQAVWCSKWCSKWCSLAPSCRQRFHESHECMPFHGLPSYTTRCSLEGTVRRGKEGKRKRQCDDVNVYSFDKHTSA